MKSKRGLSEVVSTVLIILLTVAAAVIVSGFAIKFVKDNISKGDCIKYSQMVVIMNNPKYTCFENNADPSKRITRIQIGIKDLEKKYYDNIKGFKVVLTTDGVSTNYDIINDTDYVTEIVKMYKADIDGKNVIPGIGSEKTYNITGTTNKPNSITVYPVLKNDKSCSSANYQIKTIDDCI